VLVSGKGDDEMSSGGGLDTMQGGQGNDRYYVYSTTDVIVELSGATQGSDVVFTLADNYKLASNVERLYLLQGSVLSAQGNDIANVIYGNTNANLISGLGGGDRLMGYAGNDTLMGGAGFDVLTGGLGNDTYVYNPDEGYDVISNFDKTGNDTLVIHGATEAQIWLQMLGTDLGISVIGRNGEVYVQEWTSGRDYQIDSIKLDNGKTLSVDKVQGLVNAMSAFVAPDLGQTTLPANYQTALNGTIASSWV
jgi:Ca2+-binding RTX toxin-like protein